MQVSVRRFRVRSLAVVVGALVASAALSASPAIADTPAFVPWSQLLPSFTTGYEPSSSNVCVSGANACVDSVIAEMEARVRAARRACNHNVMFGLMYLRTTEEYRRSALTPGFFSDPAFINHQDAGFAKQYFDAWDSYRGRRPRPHAQGVADRVQGRRPEEGRRPRQHAARHVRRT